jgi:integrase
MVFAWRAEALSEATLETYLDHLGRMERDLPGGLTGATKDRLALYLAGLSPAQGAWALRSYRRWVAAAELPDISQGLRRPKEQETPQPTVTPDDIEAALAAFDPKAKTTADLPLHKLRAITVCAVLWATGMRVSELLRMRVADVDLTEGLVTIPVTKVKKPRVTILDDRAVAWLRRWIKTTSPTDRVFPVSKRSLQRDCKRLVGYAPHSFRRGWAVESLRAGVSQVSVQAVAGWSSGAMCQRYVRALSQELAVYEFRTRRAS